MLEYVPEVIQIRWLKGTFVYEKATDRFVIGEEGLG
jgi:hypothetical protein